VKEPGLSPCWLCAIDGQENELTHTSCVRGSAQLDERGPDSPPTETEYVMVGRIERVINV
jgi:hypothetical protein